MTDPNEPSDDNALSRVMDEGSDLVRSSGVSPMAAIAKSEVEAQLAAAHRYPRVFSKFVREAETIACTSQAVAQSCMYTLKRKDADGTQKNIVGPSIRLAEICATTYRNLHAGARPVDEDETTVTCQGVCWDIERNVRVVTEVKRRITTKSGKRYSDDMVIVTMNACNAIAYRNAVFRVIPRALIDSIFAQVRLTATGGKKPMAEKRVEIVTRLNGLGVPTDRILLAVGRARAEDLTIEDIEALIGFGTRVRDGESVDEVFEKAAIIDVTAASAAAEGKRTPMRKPADKPVAAASTPVTPDQRAADDRDQAKREEEEDRRGDDPDLDHLRGRKPPPADPGPSDNDAPPWVR